MIKKLIILISLIMTNSIYANLEIKLGNVPNNHQVYIQSYVHNTKIKAFRISGTSAIISDYKLQDAPDAAYTVTVEGPDHTYSCATPKLLEFMFFLSQKDNARFTLTMRNNKEYGLIAMCSNYVSSKRQE